MRLCIDKLLYILLNVNGTLCSIYHVGIFMHFIIKGCTIKYLYILRLEFTAYNAKERMKPYWPLWSEGSFCAFK